MILVNIGKAIKIHAGGFVFKRGRPLEVPLEKLSAVALAQIKGNADIREAKPADVAKAKSDIDIVLDTPGYEPPAGHEIHERKAKKAKA